MEALTVVLDGAILAWLVGTWFYEGHHRRCTVRYFCPECDKKGVVECATHEEHR